MPDYTEKLKLKKPLLNEAADIQVINENMDILDAELKRFEGLTNYDDTEIKNDLTAANIAIGQLQTRAEATDTTVGKLQTQVNDINTEVQTLKKYPIFETLILTAANWSTATPSTYTVTDARYTADISVWDVTFPSPSNITEVEKEALIAADIDIDGSHDGYFTLIANGDKPAIDLPVLVKIERL